jgi:hypothetical protein
VAPPAKIPDPLERRHLIERNLDPGRSLEIAEAYLAAGKPVEAVVFLRKAGARERLASLREDAVREGDFFLVRELNAALGEDLEAERWQALAAAAQAAGKERYAAEARRQAERREA